MSFTVFSYNATVLLIQPNPAHQMCWKMRPNPTQPNPTHGWTQPMSISGTGLPRLSWKRPLNGSSSSLELQLGWGLEAHVLETDVLQSAVWAVWVCHLVRYWRCIRRRTCWLRRPSTATWSSVILYARSPGPGGASRGRSSAARGPAQASSPCHSSASGPTAR